MQLSARVIFKLFRHFSTLCLVANVLQMRICNGNDDSSSRSSSVDVESSLKCSEPRCEVKKFTMKLTNRFVNEVCDWLHVGKQPIKC